MSIEQSIKEILHTTQQEQANKKQEIIQKGKQLSFNELTQIITKYNYQIEQMKSLLKNPELTEIEKAKYQTQLFSLGQQRRNYQNKLMEYF